MTLPTLLIKWNPCFSSSPLKVYLTDPDTTIIAAFTFMLALIRTVPFLYSFILDLLLSSLSSV